MLMSRSKEFDGGIMDNLVYYLLQPFMRNGKVVYAKAARALGLTVWQVQELESWRRTAVRVDVLAVALERLAFSDSEHVMSMFRYLLQVVRDNELNRNVAI